MIKDFKHRSDNDSQNIFQQTSIASKFDACELAFIQQNTSDSPSKQQDDL